MKTVGATQETQCVHGSHNFFLKFTVGPSLTEAVIALKVSHHAKSCKLSVELKRVLICR